ncbi:MAG: hypothetical protein ACRDXE_09495, partial [Acidimicrobiales bacterium]
VAVLADMDYHGPAHVAALAVTHRDCETLADRIRHDLVDRGDIGGPALEGPGWSGPRSYQAGDHILLHAHARLADGRRLTNGTTATVTADTPAGLTDRAHSDWEEACLPAAFVPGRALDGRPQVSHAWARTIDGVQGGTWQQVHLLATPAIDRHRGYVGQSRSIGPTHTWNTTPSPAVEDDHGGRIVAPRGTPAEQIAAALARAEPKTFAATDDPYRAEAAIRAEQARHQKHLDRRPPDVTDKIEAAQATVENRERQLAETTARLAYWQEQHVGTAGIRNLTPGRRRVHADAAVRITSAGMAVDRARQAVDDACYDLDHLKSQQAARVRFDGTNQWRLERVSQLDHQVDQQWTAAVVGAARDGHPHAYGTGHLRAARQALIAQINTADIGRTPAGHAPAFIGDPLQALADIDRAVTDATRVPTPQLAQRLTAPAPIRPSVSLGHHPVSVPQATPAPTPRPPTIQP